ncbi:hypothetical protein KAR04_00695 [Candidatus Calescamantes bacterium]|nr:hypothetical protein [Candidatus Calescamantes bacterium]
MKEKRSFISAVITGLLLLLFLPACVVSQHPLSPVEKGRTPHWFEGSWEQIDGDDEITFLRDKASRTYTMITSDGKDTNLCHLTRVKGGYIVNIKYDISEEKKLKESDAFADLKSVYFFLYIKRKGKKLYMHKLETKYFAGAINDKRLIGETEDNGEDGLVVLKDVSGNMKKEINKYIKKGIPSEKIDVYMESKNE